MVEGPQQIVTANEPPAREVKTINMSDNAAFDIISDNRVFDMRGWCEVPPERSTDFVSAVTNYRRIELRKNAPADVFEREARTSGLDLFWKKPEGFSSFCGSRKL